MSWDVPRSWTTIRNCCSHRLITCEQALLFGQGKRTAGERASERRSREGPRLLSRASCASIFPDFAQMESLLAGYWLKEGLTVRNTGKANVPCPLSNKFTFPASLRGKRAFSINLSWEKKKISLQIDTLSLSTAYSTQLLSAVIAVSASFKSATCRMPSFYYSTRIRKMNSGRRGKVTSSCK